MRDDVKQTFKVLMLHHHHNASCDLIQELCNVITSGNSPHVSPMLLALALLCFQLSSEEETQVRGVAVVSYSYWLFHRELMSWATWLFRQMCLDIFCKFFNMKNLLETQ